MDGISAFNQFVARHSPQLLSSGIPQHFWKTLHRKLEYDIFDAGSSFSLFLIDYGDTKRDETSPVWTVCVSKEEGINANDSNEIYLIDHAWTFQLNQVKQQLNDYPQLATRMVSIMGIDENENNETVINEKILQKIWKYCQFYSIQGIETQGINQDVESRMPIWYIMDELGCAINHSDQPNFRLVPFLYIPRQITYSLLFPICDCDEGDQVTRDYIENISKEDTTKKLIRKALLLPWLYTDFTNENFTQKEPSPEYFLTDRILESLPDESVQEPKIDYNRPLKVFTEYSVLRQYLTSSQFQIVDNENDADIIWTTKHYKTFEELSIDSPNKFINQFPHENIITVKDLLSIVCRRANNNEKHHDDQTLETYPKWLPTTYNLKTELIEFVSYFQNRSKKNLDNHWIIKPFNLARGLDIYITSNLSQIMRLPLTGPKIAQKYIENPVLYYRDDLQTNVKFDIRYVIALKSVKPLKVYTYKKFFLRFANQTFSLDNFEEYEKHFTVMNYTENAELRRIEYDEFIKKWNNIYGQESSNDYNWNTIENDIHEILKELFVCATKYEPPISIAHSPQSRAIYAADIMLSWENDEKKRIQPKLLEINWMPDCKRACQYYPEFFNDIFKLLFLNEVGNNFRLVV